MKVTKGAFGFLALTVSVAAPAAAVEPPPSGQVLREGVWTTSPEPLESEVSEPVSAGAVSRRRGPDNLTLDFGLHTYLARSKYFAGAQLGVGIDFFAVRFDAGALWNSQRVDRFDTTFLGPYLSPSLWLYPVRTEPFELRGGLGFMAVGLTAVDDSVWYFAGMASVAGNYYFADHFSAFLCVNVLPVRTEGFVIGVAPVLVQTGLEVSLW